MGISGLFDVKRLTSAVQPGAKGGAAGAMFDERK
jgi:hypothetical protein